MGSLTVAGTITTADVDRWIREFGRLVAENKTLLTDLDAAVGDADHGSNMARGMAAAGEAMDATSPETPGALLKSVGMTLVSKVGGASGPLFGTFFLRMGGVTASEWSADDLATALRAGLTGVVDRGKAAPGDKTMLDALTPAVDALESAVAAGADTSAALKSAAEAAREGCEATIPMLARKGRASYLGERSVGHQDPGATTVTLLFDAAATHLTDAGAGAAQ